MIFEKILNYSFLHETGEIISGNYEMVQHFDVDQFAGFNEFLCDLDVLR